MEQKLNGVYKLMLFCLAFLDFKCRSLRCWAVRWLGTWPLVCWWERVCRCILNARNLHFFTRLWFITWKPVGFKSLNSHGLWVLCYLHRSMLSKCWILYISYCGSFGVALFSCNIKQFSAFTPLVCLQLPQPPSPARCRQVRQVARGVVILHVHACTSWALCGTSHVYQDDGDQCNTCACVMQQKLNDVFQLTFILPDLS
jgi:hypothetical protein